MAGRIRSIKPEILDDEKTAGLSDAEFRMFQGIILLADDHGSFRANARWLASQIWWSHEPSQDPRESLATLSRVSLVTIYKHSGQVYGHVTNWERHQKIDHPSKPRLPQVDDEESCVITLVCESSVSVCATDSRDSRELFEDSPRDSRLISDLRSPISDQDLHMSSSPSAPIDEFKLDPEPRPAKAKSTVADVGAVFDTWAKLHKPKAKLTAGRTARIKARLKEGFTCADLCRAVRGATNDDWIMGRDPKARPEGWRDIDTILRDAAQVERLMELSETKSNPEWPDLPPLKVALPEDGEGPAAPVPPEFTAAVERLAKSMRGQA